MPYTPNRRDVLAAALGGTAAGLASPALPATTARSMALGPPKPFSFDALKTQAQALARAPYAPTALRDADVLQAIDQAAYEQVVFRSEMALWNGVAGAQPVRLFPLSRLFQEPVTIHVLAQGSAREVLYSLDAFDLPAGSPTRRLKAGGFAGFRLMNANSNSDWLAFLGASYFRSAEPFDQYGASARGLAINSGGPAKEEFPRFTAFWLEQDGHGGMTIYALLESASVAGTYRIGAQRGPGGAVQDIQATLYFRSAVDTLGLAPLTSMFWHGENSSGAQQDWRPEVHDSDGLALWTGAGERVWRPLTDPPKVTTNSFVDSGPKGFGLLQRDRSFDDYQDDALSYEKRPSLWVEPLSAWGKGAVNLVELPTVGENDDNIVVFWTPAQKIQAGATIDTAYRLHWTSADTPVAVGARVVATRIGPGSKPGARRFVVDMEGPALVGLSRGAGVEAVVNASHGHIDAIAAYPVADAHRWRMMFDLSDLGGQPADLRAYLRRSGQALSESWLYQALP